MKMLIHKYGEKTYNLQEVCAFKKTKEIFGGLSNMASSFPLIVNDKHILTSEALYQACRFPHLSEVQKAIIAEKSPMSAKMKSKPHRDNSRPDFEERKVDIMRWCLRIKLAQNFFPFAQLLESTGDRDIVENSHKDRFWGAIPDKEQEHLLTGANVLGRLLKQLRKEYHEYKFFNLSKILYVEPLKIKDFLLFGEPIRAVDEREKFLNLIKKQLNIVTPTEKPRMGLYIESVDATESTTVNEPNLEIKKDKNIKKSKSEKIDKIDKNGKASQTKLF